MSNGANWWGFERDSTDAALEAERQRTDEELLRRAEAARDDAEEVLARARERAAEVLRRARTRVDALAGRAGHDRAVERAAEDTAVAEEYAAADAGRDGERQARERELDRLLAAERAHMDRTLDVERERADASIAARDTVLAMVSHDVRNLLDGIAVNAALIVSAANEDPDGRIAAMRADRIQRFTRRLDRLVHDLLDAMALETGRLGVDPKPGDLMQVIGDAAEYLQPRCSDAGISFRQPPGGDQLPALFDYDRTFQVLANLLGNAAKFTPAGGEIHVSATRREGFVEVAVADTGRGVAPEDRERIFERFVRSQTTQGGLGLGLYIARLLVEAQGGRLWVEAPASGPGSTFRFTLPAVP